MNRWYRQSFPPFYLVYAYFAVIVLADIAAFFAWFFWGNHLSAARSLRLLFPFAIVGTGAGIPAAGLLAFCKIERFPGFGSEYYEWLATTPWQADKRSPFGPWHPVVQDAVPLSVLSLVGIVHGLFLAWCISNPFASTQFANPFQWHFAVFPPVATLAAFFAVWTICGYVRVFWQWDRSIYAVLLTINVLFLLTVYDLVLIATVFGILAFVTAVSLVWRRMQFVLSELPLRHLTNRDPIPKPRLSSSSTDCPVPYAVKSHVIEWMENNRSRAFAYSLLIFLSIIPFPSDPFSLIFFPLGLLVLSLCRRIAYSERRVSHLGILARWSTRKFVVPEFDRVWIPSIWMTLAGSLFAVAGYFEFLPANISAALAVSVAVLIGMASGPDFAEWELTAPSRLTRRTNTQRRRTPNSLTSMTGISSSEARN